MDVNLFLGGFVVESTSDMEIAKLELGVICESCDHVGEDGVDEENEDE